jgi:hypothetical protein
MEPHAGNDVACVGGVNFDLHSRDFSRPLVTFLVVPKQSGNTTPVSGKNRYSRRIDIRASAFIWQESF